MEKQTDTVCPEYYTHFKCKCGECRHVCCSGWEITVTEAEYYHLIGLSCKRSLRKKLDSAFVLLELPEPECFARIAPDYNGNCPMLDSEGFCSLQRECGESALPLVCRVYPRSIKSGATHEACTSLSCERTVELLIENTQPLRFICRKLDLPFDGLTPLHGSDEHDAVRCACIAKMQNRSESLAMRLKSVGGYLTGNDIPLPEKTDYEKALKLICRLVYSLERVSPNISDCGSRALSYLGIDNSADDKDLAEGALRYRAAVSALKMMLPDVDIYFEKLLINHMFYEQFPFVSDDSSSLFISAFSSLCIVYTLLLLVTSCDMASSTGSAGFVDIVAELFRFIEHSDFYAFVHPSGIPEEMKLWAELLPLME